MNVSSAAEDWAFTPKNNPEDCTADPGVLPWKCRLSAVEEPVSVRLVKAGAQAGGCCLLCELVLQLSMSY